MPHHSDQDGFSLIELIVVVVIIGILAAIAIPRFLDQRQNAWNTTAVADLRNLVAVQTALEAGPGLSDDPMVLAAEGWEVSDPNVVVCAELAPDGSDITLTAWHASGTVVYSWQRLDPRLATAEVAVPADCAAATGGAGVTVS